LSEDANKDRTPPPFHHSEIEFENRFRQAGGLRPLKRTYAQAGEYLIFIPRLTDLIDAADVLNPVATPQEPAPKRTRSVTTTEQLHLLNCVDCPGLTVTEFRNLFIKCDTCSLLTTRDVFFFHACQAGVIDLTRGDVTTAGQMDRLNCLNRPGLTAAEFRDLFVKCRVCHTLTTRDVFVFHVCEVEVIDLTDED
jgi:hypothetical protein